MSRLHSINADYRPTGNQILSVYVLKAGEGFTTLGFDYCVEQSKKMRAWLKENGVDLFSNKSIEDACGTADGYNIYEALMDAGAKLCEEQRIRCNINLCPQLLGLEGKIVEVVDRYNEQRRFRVGRSTGWLPVHLEIEKRSEIGGLAVTGTPFKSVRTV